MAYATFPWAANSTLPDGYTPRYSPGPSRAATPGASAVGASYGSGGPYDIASITQLVNNLNLSGQKASNVSRIPNAAALEQTSSSNIGSELKGQLPPDVIRLMQQQAAERGTATGTSGSPNNNAAYLQALGLTSLGLEEQGQGDLTKAYARNPGAPLFDPTTQLLTPYQSGELNLQTQSEADRTGLEEERLALEAARGYGGGGGVRSYGGKLSSGSTFDAGAGGPPEVYGGPLGGGGAAGGIYDLTPRDATQEWWNSIGFTPGQTSGVGTEGSGSFYAGPNNIPTTGEASMVQGFED